MPDLPDFLLDDPEVDRVEDEIAPPAPVPSSRTLSRSNPATAREREIGSKKPEDVASRPTPGPAPRARDVLPSPTPTGTARRAAPTPTSPQRAEKPNEVIAELRIAGVDDEQRAEEVRSTVAAMERNHLNR